MKVGKNWWAKKFISLKNTSNCIWNMFWVVRASRWASNSSLQYYHSTRYSIRGQQSVYAVYNREFSCCKGGYKFVENMASATRTWCGRFDYNSIFINRNYVFHLKVTLWLSKIENYTLCSHNVLRNH